MSAIECGDGQDVHEGKDDAQEGCHQPESMPVPHGWEEASQCAKTTQALGSLLGEDVFHVAHIARQHIPAILDAGREALEESVTDVSHLIVAYNIVVDESHAGVSL